MKMDCEVIRDLLPLYADNACSEKSRGMVEEHLQECPACGSLLKQLKETEIENGLQSEKSSVLKYGTSRFKRRSALAGTIVAGIFMIPVLVCLIVNMASGHGLNWFFIVLASLCVAASLIIVPLMMPEDKLFWTFCSFTASLLVLFAVVCIYTRGSWFFIASSSSLFGLSAIFLPFVIKARPVKELIGGSSRWLIVLGTDAVLFLLMMISIFHKNAFSGRNILFMAGAVAGIAMIVLEILKKGEEKNEKR